MDALLDELICKIEVVLQGVFLAFRICNIPRIADGALNDTACLLSGIDTEFEVIEVVERAVYRRQGTLLLGPAPQLLGGGGNGKG